MKNRRTRCETNSQKSAHRVRSLVCETNKFGSPGLLQMVDLKHISFLITMIEYAKERGKTVDYLETVKE